jgi:hypothetical protein
VPERRTVGIHNKWTMIQRPVAEDRLACQNAVLPQHPT